MNIYGNSVGHPLPDPRKGMEMSGPINMNGQSLKGLNAPTEDGDAVNWGSVKPKAGFIYPLAAAVVPEGFLLCDGAAYARSEYLELFAAIGTMYGSGDGATTFNVPDLRNRVPAGSSENHPAGEMVGSETHQLTKEELPSDMGTNGQAFILSNSAAAVAQTAVSSGVSNQSDVLFPDAVFKDQPHNNMQPTTFIHGYIIATGKGTGVSVADIILGAQALPLSLEYGGVGATDPKTARENLEITPENIGAEPAGAARMELLWENASPNSSIAAQSISFDKKSYKMFMVVDNNGTTAIVYDNGNSFVSFYMPTAISFRQLAITKTGMTIGDAYLYWYGSSNTSVDNNYNIIAKVYGIGGVPA